jgi:phosphate transport system permease protein
MDKRVKEKIAFWIFRILSFFVIGVLMWILGFIFIRGFSVLSWDFLTQMPEDGMTKGGIFPAIVGTFCLILGSMVFAFPIGVMAGIYMHEYVKEGFFKTLNQIDDEQPCRNTIHCFRIVRHGTLR